MSINGEMELGEWKIAPYFVGKGHDADASDEAYALHDAAAAALGCDGLTSGVSDALLFALKFGPENGTQIPANLRGTPLVFATGSESEWLWLWCSRRWLDANEERAHLRVASVDDPSRVVQAVVELDPQPAQRHHKVWDRLPATARPRLYRILELGVGMSMFGGTPVSVERVKDAVRRFDSIGPQGPGPLMSGRLGLSSL